MTPTTTPDYVRLLTAFETALTDLLAAVGEPLKGAIDLPRLQRIHALQDAFDPFAGRVRGAVQRLPGVLDDLPGELAAARFKLLAAKVQDPDCPVICAMDVEYPDSVPLKLGRHGFTVRCWVARAKSLDDDHPARPLFGPDDHVDLDRLGRCLVLSDQPGDPKGGMWLASRVLELTRKAREGWEADKAGREFRRRQQELELEVQRANQPPTPEERISQLELQVATLLATTDAK